MPGRERGVLSRPMTTPTSDDPARKKREGRIAALLAFLLIGSCAFCSTRGNDGDPDDDSARAYVECKSYVRDRLKAPATAEFSSFNSSTVTHDGTRYTVEGTVDSENGFGAKIRNTFTCVVTGSGTSWTLERIDGLTN